MAQFPYLLQAGFEGNALDGDLAETDTLSAGAIIHYTDLVKKHKIPPWRGAYAYLIDESICTTTECKLVSAGCNVTTAYYWSMGFAFYAKSTTMATTNCTSLVKLLNSATVEGCLSLYYTTAGGLQIGITETVPGTAPTVVAPLTENKWHWIELYGRNHASAGTVYLVLDGEAIGSLSSLAQGALTSMQIGLDEQDAGHTAGIYVFDDIYFSGEDSATQPRIGLRSQFPWNPHVSAISTSAYLDCLFVGPGTIADMTLLTSNAGDYIRLYDTDTGAYTGTYAGTLVAEAAVNPSVPIVAGPLAFERGCLAVIYGAGANGARAVVRIEPNPCESPAPICYNNRANLFNYAYQRTRRPGNL